MSTAAPPVSLDQSARETVESIIVAVILAFLFRGFVAEAFVIPTGSMAPTLQGRHMDVVCPECGYQYRAGASIENEEFGPAHGEVTTTRCPICRFVLDLDKERDVNQRSFNGDRILVSKFAYQYQEPQRWDVIVFKYPGNAKINYIKRLVGLPGETLRIRHGDVHLLDSATRNEPPDKQRYQIIRKPPEKVLAMLQVVDDTRFTSASLRQAGWPSRWVATAPAGWRVTDDGGFAAESPETPVWLRYRHLIPRREDWRKLREGQPVQLEEDYSGRLITDYYAYNDASPQYHDDGDYWVGDLAVECEIDIRNGSGDLWLDLVEGGTHYRCSFAVATGQATLSIEGEPQVFRSADGKSVKSPSAMTSVRGTGAHRLRFANVDDQLHLWVDEKVVQFDGPTTFIPAEDVLPHWSPEDPGDLQPAGVGVRGLDVKVVSLRVARDVYYRAVESDIGRDTEYDSERMRSGDNIDTVMSRPASWSTTNLFLARRSVTFPLGPDQFFPLGDNSPQSKDARLWSNGRHADGYTDPPPFVERDLLIGRALAIYWPHGWRFRTVRFGMIPNFQRIGLIR